MVWVCTMVASASTCTVSLASPMRNADVDLDVVVDAEHDAALHVLLEAERGGLQPVGTDGQIGNSVDAIIVGLGGMNRAGIDRGKHDGSVADGGALRVHDAARHVGDGDRLRAQRGQQAAEGQQKQGDDG